MKKHLFFLVLLVMVILSFPFSASASSPYYYTEQPLLFNQFPSFSPTRSYYFIQYFRNDSGYYYFLYCSNSPIYFNSQHTTFTLSAVSDSALYVLVEPFVFELVSNLPAGGTWGSGDLNAIYSNVDMFDTDGNIVIYSSPLLSASFDGSIFVDGITVRNDTRYAQDLTYSISFDSESLKGKFSSTVFNKILQLGYESYYNLSVPSSTWLASTATSIDDFDTWYSSRSAQPQNVVCNSYQSYTYRSHDEFIDLGVAYNRVNQVSNLSNLTSQIYGRSLTSTEQKLFDTLTYVNTVGVRSKWLLSSVFGYGSLRIINIGPTLLNGRAISGNGFGGSIDSDNVNSYLYNDNSLTDTDFNNTSTVVNSTNNTTINYPDQTVITNNYNNYYNTVNYYPVVSNPAIQNVYVVNYDDFNSDVNYTTNQDIINNYDFNIGDLNISAGISSAAGNIADGFNAITGDCENGNPAQLGTLFVSLIPSDLLFVFFAVFGLSVAALVINKMRS